MYKRESYNREKMKNKLLIGKFLGKKKQEIKKGNYHCVAVLINQN